MIQEEPKKEEVEVDESIIESLEFNDKENQENKNDNYDIFTLDKEDEIENDLDKLFQKSRDSFAQENKKSTLLANPIKIDMKKSKEILNKIKPISKAVDESVNLNDLRLEKKLTKMNMVLKKIDVEEDEDDGKSELEEQINKTNEKISLNKILITSEDDKKILKVNSPKIGGKENKLKKRFYEFLNKIKSGKDLEENDKDLLMMRDFSGWTPLHWAVNSNDLEKVKWLISKGADVNALTNHKWSCLHIGASKGSKEVVTYLLQIPNIIKEPKDIYGKAPHQYVNKSKDIYSLLDTKRGVPFL